MIGVNLGREILEADVIDMWQGVESDGHGRDFEMGETCGGGSDRGMCYASGIARHIISVIKGVTAKFADVEIARFDVGDERAYRGVGH